MSTLKTNNIEHLDASTPSIQTTIGGGTILAGVSTVSGTLNVGSGTSISSPATNTLALGTNGTERLRITSAGYVGIGSDVPEEELDVHGNIITGGLKLVNNDRGNPTRKIVVGSSSVYHIRLYDPTDTTKLQSVFKVDGTVGIGTDNPVYKLDVRPTPSDPTTGSPPAGAFLQIRADDATVGNGPSLSLVNLGGTKETGWRISAVSTSGNNGDLVFNGYAGGATYPEVARFTSAGNLKFPSGQGIDFSASGNAGGMTSELLDDYEEGAHVPALFPTTGTLGSITYSGDTGGKYIKIGSIVHFWGTIRWTAYNTGTGSGSIQVSMPFTNVARTSGDDADNAGPAYTPVWGGTSNKIPTAVYGVQNQDKLGFRAGSNDTVATAVQVSQVGPTGMVNFSITYQTSV